MVIDFSKIDLKEQPVLVLRNLDGTAIQPLGYAFNLKAEICYDEVSNITFDLPAYVDGEKTPRYDDVIGSRIIDMLGWGQFILINPSVEKDGVKEIKSCKAYSLEYELTYKKLSITEGTYNFYNPVTPNETIIGIILSYLPSWSIGAIDEALIGKYRTFSINDENIYNFIKSTVQKTYDCIFEFDTYQRKINVKAVSSKLSTSPTFISLNNLASSISVEEDTENIFTVLDVNGADGVTIRSVNPMGTNKIYNLDYYMNPGHFSSEIIEKWNDWKTSYKNYQLTYYNITIERMLKTAAILTEENRLTELVDAELASLEQKQASYIENLASLSDTNSETYEYTQKKLKEVNAQISETNQKIIDCKQYIETLKSEKDTLTDELEKINEDVSFSKYFTDEEIIVLNRYFKEDSISDSSFVVATTEAYTSNDVSSVLNNTTLAFTGGTVTKTTLDTGKEIFTVEGGTLSSVNPAINANVIRASIECKDTGDFVFSGHIGVGELYGENFVSGCVSLSGTCEELISNVTPDAELGELANGYQTGTELSFYIDSARLYFTRNTTEYEQFSVEWDLYEYGCQCLDRLAYPSYTFDVSSANFFALEEFESFAKKLALGNKLYLSLDDDVVLEPIFVGMSIEFENLSSLNLQFGDKFSLSDSAFSLVDLLEKSVSMGKTVDTSRFNYNSFIESGAATVVKEFIDSSLDVSKNAILSGKNMAISWDASGIKCRKYTEDGTGYEPEQIAIINNCITFTDDSWQSAKMAIGKFEDTNLGETWGIVAPNIVGTLLAGSNLVIESAKKDGGVSVFRVDADGAVLHNARFDIENGVSHIMLDPTLGFGIGKYPVIDNESNTWDTDNAKFWVDTRGNIHFKGTLEGCSGIFSGELYAAYGTFEGELVAATGTFEGDISAATGTFHGSVQAEEFFDSEGNKMLDEGMFKSSYLNLRGLIITDSDDNTTLEISESGDITMCGTLASSAIESSTITSSEIKTSVLNSPIIIGEGISFGEDMSWGQLCIGQGSSTEVVELNSTKGLVLHAINGGLRLMGSSGIWLSRGASAIHILRNNNGSNYVTLQDFVSELIDEAISDLREELNSTT